jgi:hypothetical protein
MTFLEKFESLEVATSDRYDNDRVTEEKAGHHGIAYLVLSPRLSRVQGSRVRHPAPLRSDGWTSQHLLCLHTNLPWLYGRVPRWFDLRSVTITSELGFQPRGPS